MGEVYLSSAQVSSAKTLLNKVLPDLQAITIGGEEEDGSIRITQTIERRIVRPSD